MGAARLVPPLWIWSLNVLLGSRARRAEAALLRHLLEGASYSLAKLSASSCKGGGARE